jgi:hypothetical protein
MAFAWAVDPLAFSVCFPPQLTFADDEPEELNEPDVAPAPLVVLLFPHAESIIAPLANTLSAAPNRLSFKIVPLNGRCDDYFHCATS